MQLVREWLLQRLEYVYAPGGRYGSAARAMCSHSNAPCALAASALRKDLRVVESGRVLQAAMRRCLQVDLSALPLAHLSSASELLCMPTSRLHRVLARLRRLPQARVRVRC